MQRLHPMHRIASTSLPYRRLSAPATLVDPITAATGTPANSFKKRLLFIFAGGFSIDFNFFILPGLF
jgi:hypothetical protein